VTIGQRAGPSSRQHLGIALISIWLIGSSPWIAMLRRIPDHASWIDYAHVAVGFIGLALAIAYFLGCTRGGGWRLYFPWLSGRWRDVTRDLAGILRGRVPVAEGGGLFAMIEGLLLLALLFTALTGVAWFVTQGSVDALAWRDCHVVAARVLVGLVLAHVISVSLHLVEFVSS
jgi:hypothetical protein